MNFALLSVDRVGHIARDRLRRCVALAIELFDANDAATAHEIFLLFGNGSANMQLPNMDTSEAWSMLD